MRMREDIQIEKLQIDPLYVNRLNIHCFALMLESTTQSYKFYWLEAILTLLPDKDEMTFKEVIYEMFWEAWFTVSLYHLHLGPTINGKSENLIEHAIHVIEQDSEVKMPITREQFMILLDKNRDKIKADVDGLIKNVPYRLLSPFLADIGGNDPIWYQKKRLITYLISINRDNCLPYIIEDGVGAKKTIILHPAWKQVLIDNYAIVKSWIQMKKIQFLQNRNPGVPGIVYKLDEEKRVRKLEKVRDLWVAYQAVTGRDIPDLYSSSPVQNGKLSIDHFVPWSYVTSDELWNLVPMNRENNSSKGNRLPNWNRFFPKLSRVQYDLYELIYSNNLMRRKFESCKSQNLNALWAIELLYVPGNSLQEFTNILEHNLKPIYESAVLQGYEEWKK